MTLIKFINTSLGLIIMVIIKNKFDYDIALFQLHSNFMSWIIACYSANLSIIDDKKNLFFGVLYALIILIVTFGSVKLVLYLFLGKDF